MLPSGSKRQLTELAAFLAGHLTENRVKRIDAVLAERTRYVTVVLEDIYQPHNASAVLRSCECFGIQDIHVIENKNKYTVNPEIALGASQWINLIRYNEENEDNTATCIRGLKRAGYRIVSAIPDVDATALPDFDVAKGKFALVFGKEITGHSDTALQHSDEKITIPMCGFTESFNISVSAAICLYEFFLKLRKSATDWHLREDEILKTKIEWMTNSIKSGKLLVNEFWKKRPVE